jgi:hypothetical protein
LGKFDRQNEQKHSRALTASLPNHKENIMTFQKCVFVCLLAAGSLLAQPRQRYEVTITNLTKAQRFTPVVVASHEAGLKLFELGKPASPELRLLAEEGNFGPLAAQIAASGKALQVTNTPPPPPVSNLIGPGQSVTVMLDAGGKFDHFSVASMLIPTNDAFFALNGMPGPQGNETVTYLVPAYDAGTERNDELCASIPGPDFMECGGGGGGAQVGMGEGFVYIHNGMHGVGNFNKAMRDWRNPVAQITIKRAK